MLGRRKRVLVDATAITPGANRRLVRVGNESRELVPLPSSPSEVLTWRQPQFLVGTWWLESANGTHLLFHIPGPAFRTPRDCPAESVTGSWSIHMGWGFFRESAPIRDRSGEIVASHEPGFFGNSRIRLADGRVLTLGFRGWNYVLSDDAGVTLVTLRHRWAWFRFEADVTLSAEGLARADRDLLLAIMLMAYVDRTRHRH